MEMLQVREKEIFDTLKKIKGKKFITITKKYLGKAESILKK
ncbi:MAG: hypothetical protein Q8O03_08665 [Nanoarchaeota archaeon]|nr:hypothetical protein [Nanoarchaeota archaeon]